MQPILEHLLFLASATLFLAIVGRIWQNTKPFDLPQSLPTWFKFWFATVLVVGIGLPLIAISWSVLQGDTIVLRILIPYFVLLSVQILTESIILRRFHSVVWVMVPYVYLPYRLWQLYQGVSLLNSESHLMVFRTLLQVEIILWAANYGFNLLLLPRLLRWDDDNASSLHPSR